MQDSNEQYRKENSGGESTPGSGMNSPAPRSGAAIPRLYPELSQQECREAMANLRRHFEIAIAIADERAQQGVDLTALESIPTMKERSSDNLKI
jgi:hypothetical protein